MHYKTGCSREQFMLFNSLEDSIEPDNPVRLIDLLVDTLYQNDSSRFDYKGLTHTGQKAYSPTLFL